MTDDRIPPPPHPAAGDRPRSAAPAARGRRRRAVRIVVSALVAAVVLIGGALAVIARPTRQAVQLAPGADDPSGSAADVHTAGGATALPPRAEGEVVGTDDGFVLVSGAAPPQVWSSPDGRRWVRRSAPGLPDDPVVDVAAASDGAVAVLTGTGQLWTSGTAGGVWRELVLPDGVGRPDQVAGDRRRWYLAGASGGGVRLVAVPRDASDGVREVVGDLDVPGLRRDRPPALVASGPAGTVLVADRVQGSVAWIVDDGTATRVDDAFGGARVAGVTATGDGFAATVVPAGADRPELWRSADGRTWAAATDALPVPSCAVVVEAAGAAVAGGSPCDEDAGWQLWRRTADDGWVRIGREVERR